jgi:hypothetical protein
MDASVMSPKTPAEYRAVIEDQLRQLAQMHERMSQNRGEIEQLRVEAAALRADTDLVLTRIDVHLAAIQSLL